ncbi:MAG: hypothetical protein HRT61_23850 [Ekhidna sp.]|nr:hypothetical protein [Ekhidna sp.]
MVIRLREALRQMDKRDAEGNPVRFKIKWHTFNRSTQAGGELKLLKQATILTSKPGKSKGERTAQAEEPKTKRNPNHFTNATRNIQCAESNEVKKLNIFLITEFNGQKVVH